MLGVVTQFEHNGFELRGVWLHMFEFEHNGFELRGVWSHMFEPQW